LGRGAFGRVFLARQSDLSGRPVALKLACDVVSESRSLAQLQHTNIMPVYSYHRANTLQAVCMPFLGRVTFADLLRSYRTDNRLPDTGRQLRSIVAETSMRRSSPDLMIGDPSPVPITIGNDWVKLEHWDYVRSIIWFGAQLAEGLAHAHSRGILHRDLKPANVLLTDDGQPMLLDFNLAADLKKARSGHVGGTLPYMAPEHLEAFARLGELRHQADRPDRAAAALEQAVVGQRPELQVDEAVDRAGIDDGVVGIARAAEG
jgi:serine/threonine protein kinase